jgi:hypothetical protein
MIEATRVIAGPSAQKPGYENRAWVLWQCPLGSKHLRQGVLFVSNPGIAPKQFEHNLSLTPRVSYR